MYENNFSTKNRNSKAMLNALLKNVALTLIFNQSTVFLLISYLEVKCISFVLSTNFLLI